MANEHEIEGETMDEEGLSGLHVRVTLSRHIQSNVGANVLRMVGSRQDADRLKMSGKSR